MKYLLATIVTIGCIIVSYSFGYNNRNKDIQFLKEANAFKYELIKEYDAYRDATEAIIDKLYEHDDNYFLDVITEYNEYCEYIEHSTKIDSLYMTQL